LTEGDFEINGGSALPRKAKTERSTFSLILRQLVDERNVTVAALSKATGIARSTLDGWQSGAAPEDFKAVRRVATFFNVSLSFILTGEDDQALQSAPTLTELFKEGTHLSGIYRIELTQLLPRKGGGNRSD
jgi:transcriptional regulator with XRE-family HTH domain